REMLGCVRRRRGEGCSSPSYSGAGPEPLSTVLAKLMGGCVGGTAPRAGDRQLGPALRAEVSVWWGVLLALQAFHAHPPCAGRGSGLATIARELGRGQ